MELFLALRDGLASALAQEIHRLASRGDEIEFYVIAPGRGHLGDLPLGLRGLERGYKDDRPLSWGVPFLK